MVPVRLAYLVRYGAFCQNKTLSSSCSTPPSSGIGPISCTPIFCTTAPFCVGGKTGRLAPFGLPVCAKLVMYFCMVVTGHDGKTLVIMAGEKKLGREVWDVIAVDNDTEDKVTERLGIADNEGVKLL